MQTLPSLFGLLIAFAMTGVEAATYELTDGVFQTGNWTQATLLDTTPGATFTVRAGQETAGGNPAEYRSFVQSSNSPGTTPVLLLSGHFYVAHTFDPARDGAIASLAASFDGLSIDATAGAVGYALLIRQAGAHFIAYGGSALNGEGWKHFSQTGLKEDSFSLVTTGGFDSTRHPDFSANGSSVTFGFAALNGTFGLSSNEGGLDNWRVSIHVITPVPLPSASLLLANALMAVASILQWRKRTEERQQWRSQRPVLTLQSSSKTWSVRNSRGNNSSSHRVDGLRPARQGCGTRSKCPVEFCIAGDRFLQRIMLNNAHACRLASRLPSGSAILPQRNQGVG